MWAEPGEAALLSTSRRSPTGAAQGAWFVERPRTVWLGVAAVVVAFALGVVAVHKPALALATLGGLALVMAVLLRPVVGGLVIVGTVPILSGMAPGVPVSHVRISELVVGLVGLTILVSARRSDAVPWSSLDWLLLAYGLAWALFGAVNAVALHEPLAITGWGTVIGQLQFFLIYRGVRTALRTPAERRSALWVLLAASVPVALLAVLQELKVGAVAHFLAKITGGTVANLSFGGVNRATGPFNNWAVLAGYLLPLLLVLFALTLAGQVTRHRALAWTVGLIALTGLLVTAEISAILMLCIGVVILARQYGQGRRALRLVGAAVVVAALVAAPFLATRFNTEFSSNAGSGRHAGVPQTLAFRWDVWTTQYIPAIEARPLSGYGVVLPPTIQWIYPESQYVSYLMEGGLPLLVLFGAMAWSMVRTTRDASRSKDPFDQAVGRAVLVTIVAVLVMNLIWPFLSNGGLPQVLWCLMAIAVPRSAPRHDPAIGALAGVGRGAP